MSDSTRELHYGDCDRLHCADDLGPGDCDCTASEDFASLTAEVERLRYNLEATRERAERGVLAVENALADHFLDYTMLTGPCGGHASESGFIRKSVVAAALAEARGVEK